MFHRRDHGLPPYGLVYTVLLIAATLPTLLHSAFGMVCFGVGTLLALSAVVSAGWRRPGCAPMVPVSPS